MIFSWLFHYCWYQKPWKVNQIRLVLNFKCNKTVKQTTGSIFEVCSKPVQLFIELQTIIKLPPQSNVGFRLFFAIFEERFNHPCAISTMKLFSPYKIISMQEKRSIIMMRYQQNGKVDNASHRITIQHCSTASCSFISQEHFSQSLRESRKAVFRSEYNGRDEVKKRSRHQRV